MSIYSAVQFQLSSYTTNKYSRSGGDKSEKMLESIDDDGAQRRQCSRVLTPTIRSMMRYLLPR